MCGIVGYIGKNNALPILIDGIKRLEYRGYDSAGIALYLGNKIESVKAVGRIKELESCLQTLGVCERADPEGLLGGLGIAHTRWATHGAPTEANAHPHTDCQGKIWLVHNGIIENYIQLKEHLISKGHKFKSDTDTEVIAHLFEDLYEGDLLATLQKTLSLIKGAYGLVLIHSDHPHKMLAAKMGSPLMVGLGDKETIIASDASAIINNTKQVIYLNDGEIADINRENLKIINSQNEVIDKKVEKIEWDIEAAQKGGYNHFMLKEIFEQPETVKNSIRGRYIIEDGKAKLGGLDNFTNKIREIKKIIIVACGTARNAGLAGKYMIEEYAGVPTEIDYASEFRYRQPILDSQTAVMVISQSGETADTLAAVREAKEKGALTLGIVNTVGSTIARETDAGVYNHIGPEISVASTKAFTSELAILSLLTVFLGRQRKMSLIMGKRILEELEILPKKIAKILAADKKIKAIAKKYKNAKNFAFLGRKYNSSIAFEGALKLKEISYIHAEGFVSGELKHGPIALIDKNMPSIFIAPKDSVYEKNMSNIEEVRARCGKIIAIATEGDEMIKKIADDIIYIPKTLELTSPLLSIIPLQLFAYYMAVLRGCDVDKPRNLAKSVTVE
ncbi:glutamine--fructose-6-phosphate transaminase (isomerizing) [Candidatus Falkowbacteria bacterium CG_4_9_14_3_um_filter_36_9]|nr:MAG: glutamine--fructose-6-phosphate transaminase (isomerizing) [Candidatus Falkowbacteria bacterium CG_4_9_14_3_um_filter_36_9]